MADKDRFEPGYVSLANHIIKKSIQEYQIAVRKRDKYAKLSQTHEKKREKARFMRLYFDSLKTIREVEEFFNSGESDYYTNLDGKLLLKRVQEELRKEGYVI